MAAFGYAAFGWLLAIAAIGLGIFVFLCAVAVLQVWWRSITKR